MADFFWNQAENSFQAVWDKFIAATKGNWGTDKGFAQVIVGKELVKDLGADNPDNNIVFAEPGNYTLTLDGDAIIIVKN